MIFKRNFKKNLKVNISNLNYLKIIEKDKTYC